MTPNRLAQETSPYLLQHAHNPVDWYPWGEEALERARSEGKPILLSVGYAACHWCHVMERESFEDQETARLMNERFVCVKVDREERPDIDAIYMSAVQAMTGHGGWPMTVFLTPDGKPFYGGTYFPPEDRHGLPSFRRVLEAVGDGWRDRREEAARQASEVIEHIERSTQPLPSSEPLAASVLSRALRSLVGAVDAEWGGFGGAPKFPQAPALEFMLRMHAGGAPDAAAPLALTLDRMARGGMFDHAGGGFARYSVDRFWHVPHFEKMLYDNAQLLRLYTRAWLAMRRPLYREVALATAEYLVRDMRHAGGGFFSSQDADSEGVEGKFYVWSRDELAVVAGADGEIVAAAFDVRPEGNWEGTNVLWRPRDDAEVASSLGIDSAEIEAALERARPRLFEARAARIPPATDDKILAGWNGLAISALAECGRALGRADLVDAAAAAAAFVVGELRTPQGRLLRSWREGRASIPAFLEDYAMVAAACLDLFETTFEPRWYAEARALAAEMLRLFSDTERGGFFDTGSDAASTVVRPRSLFDNATPSGASVAADLLLRLAALEGDPDLGRTGAGAIRVVAAALEQAPQGFGCMLGALDRYLSGAIEVAVIGDPASPGARALAGALHDRFLPNLVLAGGPPGATTPALLAGRTQLDGAATAYVCRNFACELPVTSPEDLLAQIGKQIKV